MDHISVVTEEEYLEVNPTGTRMELERIVIVKYFLQVFSEKLSDMSPEWDITFEIQLQPGAVLIASPLYRMPLVEMVKLKKQLHELLEKGFIRPSTSPWGASVLFVQEGRDTMTMHKLSSAEHHHREEQVPPAQDRRSV